MVEIKKTTITMTRGDTLYASVRMVNKDTGEEIFPSEGDTVRFALKRPNMTADGGEYVDEEPLILKTIPNETMVLKLDSTDTKSLPFGTYVYDLEITYANGDVDTFVTKAKFILDSEVH